MTQDFGSKRPVFARGQADLHWDMMLTESHWLPTCSKSKCLPCIRELGKKDSHEATEQASRHSTPSSRASQNTSSTSMQNAQARPDNLSRIEWRHPRQLPPGVGWAGTGHAGGPGRSGTVPLSHRRDSIVHYQMNADDPSSLAGWLHCRPCGARGTAVLSRPGSRVCTHARTHAHTHPAAPRAPAPPRFPEAPGRPGPHLRWR